ncbi:IclR family transcriptional regulator [Haladaptatus halobius]|uniref:IclR family transcriptional regulator n=1 Tax=Haladaptatus halobius TaxID=2884875 RepID=UPI001D0ADF33|nr:IclR family transcriptional regulator [Haladaptatus halobius]
MNKTTGGNRVRTTEKTFRIIHALKEQDGARITELANSLDMGKSTVHNHLSTLVHEGYVIKQDKEYQLSLQFLELGGYVRNQLDLYKIAKPEIKRLAEETSELANLAVSEQGVLIYIDRSKGDQAVDLDTYTGLQAPLHCTALGKAILAYLPQEQVESVLDRHGMPKLTSNTISNRQNLYQELEQIREDGFAQDQGERLEGLRCVAAPIKSSEETVKGAISVSAPSSRMKSDRYNREIPEKVRSAANVIELNLKYS